MTHPLQLALTIAFVTLMVGLETTSASIRNYSDATNNRFTNSPDYILSGFDVSGVGKEPDVTGLPNESSRWATAISRNVIISAYHGRPSGAVHFFEDNDPDTTAVVRNVVSGERVGSTDLWIGTLDAPLPSTISHFELADEFLSGTTGELTSAGSFQAMNAYLFAQIRRADDPEQDQRTGRNRVSGFVENIDFLGLADNDSILFEFDSAADPDYVTYETRFISEDSGGPTFLDIDGELTLLGINAFTYTTEEGGSGSGVTYVGNQASAIRSYISDNAIVATPEPGSFAMFGACLLILGRRKRT